MEIYVSVDSVSGWVSAGAAIGLLIAASIAACYSLKMFRAQREQLKMYRDEMNQNTFTALIREISSEEASKDRGMVKHYINDYTIKDIKHLIGKVRKGERSKAAEIGAAAERTIARLDRVGFFLGDDEGNLRMNPPIWLWTITSEMWDRLGNWVEHRQSDKSDDEFYHEGYGYYFKWLYENRPQASESVQANDTTQD